jgi:hypothetical protein
LLQTKSGQAAPSLGVIADTVYAAVSQELGLTLEALQMQLTKGSSLVAIIEANGGEVAAVREAIIASLDGLPNPETLDAAQVAVNWLSQ